MGGSSARLSIISRLEPDPQLFLVPAEYRIVDETTDFTISLSTVSQ